MANDKVIWTIGYGNSQITRFDQIMAEHPNAVLIDTRISADHAWTASFTRKQLEKRYGQNYLFAGDTLGNMARKDPGPVKWTPPVGWEMVDGFFRTTKRSLDADNCVPLWMCCELDYRRCHRQFVAQRAVEVAWKDHEIVHL